MALDRLPARGIITARRLPHPLVTFVLAALVLPALLLDAVVTTSGHAHAQAAHPTAHQAPQPPHLPTLTHTPATARAISAATSGTNTFVVTETADATQCPDTNGGISLYCAI